MAKPKITNYTWNDFDKDIDILVKKIKDSKVNFNIICGIIRGGLPIATALSHKLKLPVETTLISLRDSKARRDYWILDALDDNKTILFADDICDSGATFSWILGQYSIKKRNLLSQVKFASLIQDNDAKTKADFYGRLKENKNWIKFPWEEK